MPDKVHCAHILVKTETEAKAILDKLNKGEKFSNIAKEVSLRPSGKNGGDLGTFGRGKMVKEFETAAFALDKGQISGIVKTKFGYHIEKRPEKPLKSPSQSSFPFFVSPKTFFSLAPTNSSLCFT